MKKRSREISIFSMSSLDLFASALGAFILITVVLFPYFPNTGDSPERVADIKKDLEKALDKASKAEQEAKKAQARAIKAEGEVKKINGSATPFLLISQLWEGDGVDMDLSVKDPSGNVFWWKHRTRSGSSGELTFDSRRGPGAELFYDQTPENGLYIVCYVFWDANQPHKGTRIVTRETVRGFAFYNKKITLPDITLNAGGDAEVARIHIKGKKARFDFSHKGQLCPFINRTGKGASKD